MWSSEGKAADTEASTQQLFNTTSTDGQEESEYQEIFDLIERILPFEVCLYHQILPLSLEDNQLFLGMVDPEDSAALDYVTRIVSYINCTMATHEIADDTHRTILSAYLSYKNTSSPQDQADETSDTTSDLEESTSSSLTIEDSYHKVFALPDSETLALPTKNIVPETPKPPAEAEALPNDVTVLNLDAPQLFSPIDALINLPPRQLLAELLGRVLGGGIGRLYLERQPYTGRIIWSDNGVLQSVLENLPLSVFQGVLNELKRFVQLPVATVAEPQQVEKECQYQNSRVLLRIRVMPGANGEEATLQVLRGAALKFYQQQHLARLSRDVIGISQQLSYKLHELEQRILLNPSLESDQSQALSTLHQIIEKLDHNIKILNTNN